MTSIICGLPSDRGICLKLKDHEGSCGPEFRLRVSEIFYSLQGEGARAGEPSIFVRLSGCSAKHACAASGVDCDTEFESGKEFTTDALLTELSKAELRAVNGKEGPACKWIVLTGGEPLDQLGGSPPKGRDILHSLVEAGYKLALETSGLKGLGQGIANYFDHITISPKVAEHVLQRNWGHISRTKGLKFENEPGDYNVDELRYVRHAGQPGVPEPSLVAKYYYLSPHSDGTEINQENLQHCIKLCLENPKWRLSVQQHKFWHLL